MPALVQDVVDDAYEQSAGSVRPVVGVEREPDANHDTVPLVEPARPLATLLATASLASYVETEGPSADTGSRISE